MGGAKIDIDMVADSSGISNITAAGLDGDLGRPDEAVI